MNHREPKRQILCWMTALLAAVLSTAAGAAEPGQLAIEPAEHWSSVFADSQIKLHEMLRGPAGAEVVVSWTLRAAERTIDRGEVAVKIGETGSQNVTLG